MFNDISFFSAVIRNIERIFEPVCFNVVHEALRR